MLTVQNVTKTYGKFKALDDVSFEVPQGQAVLLIGPNGAGKTTAIKSVLGLLTFRGSIKIDGLDIRTQGTHAREKIGYVPQALVFGYNTSVLEQAHFMAKLKGAPADEVGEALKRAALWDFRQRKVNSLSHGMRQKLGISLALLKDPPFLIFDEPINNVDLKGQLDFRNIVQDLSKQGKTLLIATHLSGLSEIVGNAIVIAKGKIIAQGTPQELLTKMNAADTMYLRITEENVAKVAQIVQDILGSKISQNGEWLVFSLPPGMKSTILEKVILNGYKIKDLIVEPSTIESSYVRLLGGGTAS
ncbi:MAG TPA: ABC transporter ATP-binding protein [Nitrososphaerales archaeon]|nr:ABC transporter ATP-binding protein [Nitrososphaerales archaeon]